MADSTDFLTMQPSVMDNLVKEYADQEYLHTVTVSHNGTLIAFAMDASRRIFYAILNLAGQGEGSSQLDVDAWPENPLPVPFPTEIEQVGYSVAGCLPFAPVKIGSRKDAKLLTLQKEEIDLFLSSSARLSASAPFQVHSDGKHVFLFRQAVSSDHLDAVYTLKSRVASGDLTRPDDAFVKVDGNKVPLVDSTLLCDRFVLADTQLVMAREVRYKRSRHKTTPASKSDALGASDMEGRPFFAPTQELAFISNLANGCFDVLQLPTDIPSLKRWQFFAFNSATNRMDSFNLEVSSEGLFNPAGTQLYTSPDVLYSGAVLEREPGNCPFTSMPLVPVKVTSGHAQSCLLCKEEGDFAMADVEQWYSSAFSVELWICSDAGSLLSGAGLFSSNDDTRGSAPTSFQIDSDGSNLRFVCGETTRLCIDAIEPRWKHVAVTYNGALLVAYADGVETGRATVNDLSVSFKNYIIGSNRALDSTFRGKVDEVRVWDYCRSALSIASSKSVHLLGNDPGLRGYWCFDEGSGTTAYDHTNYACHAGLYGSRTWVLSDCPVGANYSMCRSSFSIAGRSFISGISSRLYFQQEKVPTGYDGTVKPVKKQARVLIAMTAHSTGPAEDNLLALEDASQSSTFGAGVPARGIDGNTGGVFGGDWDTSSSVTHTNCDAQPWWRAKFPALANVDKVVVYNRTDECQDRINGAIVRLFRDGEVVATEVAPGESWVSYDSGTSFSGIVADSVEVSLPGTQFLSLAEVQVFELLHGEIASIDVAVSREGKLAQIPATSELPCLERTKALDSLVEKSEKEASARALSTEIPVLQDELDKMTVDGVYEEGEDGVALAACEAALQIATNEHSAVTHFVAGNDDEFKSSYVKLRDATSSSVNGTGYPSKAIDGSAEQDYGIRRGFHTNRSSNEWFSAKFDTTAVYSVEILNRNDACMERLDGVSIHLILDGVDKAVGIYPYGSKLRFTHDFNFIVANEVKVTVRKAEFLHFAQIRVFKADPAYVKLRDAASSSVSGTGYPSKAIDGSAEQDYGIRRGFHTNRSSNEWFSAKFDTKVVTGVKIINRSDFCLERLDGVFIRLLFNGVLKAEGTYPYGSEPYYTHDFNFIVANEVKVAVCKEEFLHFAQILVFQANPAFCDPCFNTTLNAMQDAKVEADAARLIVETARNIYDNAVTLLETKKLDLAVLESWIDDISSGAEESLSVPMGQINADMSGLTVCGGLLKFAQCKWAPRLLAFGDGRVALYFCSPGRDLMAAYYNCNVKRTKFVWEENLNLSFVCRGAGDHMKSASLVISDGSDEGTCNLVLVNSASGEQESWLDLPREPQQIAGIMNGSIARPATVTATARPSYLDISTHSPHLLAAMIGNDNAPVMNGEATIFPGEYGKWFADAPGSAYFFQAGTSHLSLPPKASAKSVASDTFTIEAWVYPVNPFRTDGDTLGIIHHLSDESGYSLGLSVKTKPSGEVVFHVIGAVSQGVNGGESGVKHIRSKETIQAEEWCHLAMSYRQSYALRFNGQQYLRCGPSEMLNICGDITIEVFVLLDDLNGPHGLLGKGRFGDKGKGVPYQLRINADGLVELLFESKETIESFQSTRAVSPGVFHKIAVTRKARSTQREIEGNTTFHNPESGEDVTMKAITSVEFDEFFDITFFIDGVMSGTSKFSRNAPIGHDGELHIGRCFDSRRAVNSIRGVISEVRLWSSGLAAAKVSNDISGNESGLVSWWPMEDKKGNISSDRKGMNHGKMQGGKWERSPDPGASVFCLFKNALSLEIEDANSHSMGAWGDEGTYLAGVSVNAESTAQFRGMLEEVRVWRILRTEEQIMDNLFSRLKGELEHVLMYYTFDRNSNEANSPFLFDNGYLGNDMQLPDDVEKRPRVMLSDAPISSETAAIQSALASIETKFQDVGDSAPSVVEYADMQRDSDNNLGGVLKRCYCYVKDRKWVLVVGYKVGNLVSEWMGQAQFSPQVMGFVEGAPPVPSENLTGGVADSAENASSIEIIESDSVTYSLGVTKERSYDVGFAGGSNLGFGSNDLLITAPLGIGVGKEMTDIDVTVGWNSNFNASNAWSQEENMGKGLNSSHTMSVSTSGGMESSDESQQVNPAVGQRALPLNMGFALVQSQTADIFALRLAHNNALISFRMIPNPDIPKDWNIIPFPINEHYSKQGTLDGKIGFDAQGSPVMDEAYPGGNSYGEYSYFKPKEAYAIQRNILRKQQSSLSYYEDYDTGTAAGKVAGAIGSAAAGAAGAMIPDPGLATTIVSASAALGMYSVDSAAGDAKLNQAYSKRDLVNTYVWTAEGGFFSESTETSDVRSEVTAGNFGFSGAFSGAFSANVDVFSMGIGLEFEASLGGGMSVTKTRGKDTEKAFSMEVNVDVPGDLYKYSQDARGIWDREVIQGKEKRAYGKVDAYRFKTFYLDSATENFEDLYGKVIDPIWLNTSSHPNAVALRQTNQSGKKPPCWRVFHRVTFVSRILPEVPDSTVAPLASALKVQNIDSNWQLIQKLDPFIRDKTGSNSEFTHAVNDALKKYLPELTGFSGEIVLYMRSYYGMT